MKLIYWLATALAAMTLLALAACSEKPPGCADAEAVSAAKQVILDEARKRVTRTGIASTGDPGGLMSKYLDKATVDVSNIVDDGYDSAKHLQSCKAHIKVMPPDGDGLEGDAGYTTRRVLDAPGKFMLELEGADQFALVLQVAANNYRDANAYLGAFSGTYECAGVGGAQEGPPGPFSQQVTMNVVPAPGSPRPQATLERVSRGGGVEKLAGAASNQFELVGQGANTPDDRWTTRFSVTINGDTATGQGDIRGPDMAIARRCTLNLTRGSAAPAPTTATPVSPTPTVSASPQSAGAALAGKYVGDGDGTVTVEVGQPNAEGSYQVSMSTQASTAGGGGCGGSATGSGRVENGALQVTATDKNLGESCSVKLTPDGRGGLHSEEGKGCSMFHGAACGFGADLARR